MKSIHLLSTAALMMLLMCCSNKPAPAQQAASENKASVAETMDEDTPTDVRSFGMAGKVKEVRLSVADLSADSEGDPWVEDNKLEMSFDEQGRVTHDFYDNLYEYDASGKFVKGNHDYTKMERDAQGRVISYGEAQDEEDDMMFHYDFTYDDKGRFAKVELSFWEQFYTEELTYTGNHPYPDKITSEGDDEGEHYSTVTEYEYTKVDEHGNWTERYCTQKTTTTDEGGKVIGTENRKTKQTRVITYY